MHTDIGKQGMGIGSAPDTWNTAPLTTASKPCDSCRTAPSSIFCRADSAFLCLTCDTKIHEANKLASRHARVWVCEVCEQAPAAVTCRADAAALCTACDRDIHSANPLARRHDRVPVVPFYDAAAAANHASTKSEHSSPPAEECSADDVCGYGDLFGDVDSYLDLDLMVGCNGVGDQMQKPAGRDDPAKAVQGYGGGDGVVPVGKVEFGSGQFPGSVVDGFPTLDVDYGSAKGGFMYSFAAPSMSQSVSSSSIDVGVVPEHNPMMSDGAVKTESLPVPLSGIDREARVLRYREKRKNRKFEKTIRYASRKAYAETRPRIKGRFAKRSELDIDSLFNADESYGVVPSY